MKSKKYKKKHQTFEDNSGFIANVQFQKISTSQPRKDVFLDLSLPQELPFWDIWKDTPPLKTLQGSFWTKLRKNMSLLTICNFLLQN